MSQDEDALHDELMAELAILHDHSVFNVVEFSAGRTVIWTITRDAKNRPDARESGPLSAADLDDAADIYELKLRSRLDGARLIIVAGHAADGRPDPLLETLIRERQDAPRFYVRTPVATLLKAAFRQAPITVFYELMVLRESRSGELRRDAVRIFPPGAKPGYSESVAIRCESTGAEGTTFAMIIRKRGRIQVVTAQSAVVPPGGYLLTAVLTQPGRVRFEGLPAGPAPETRAWDDINAKVPARLHRPPPAHLVCALEVSDSADELGTRLERAAELIRAADAGDGRLAVSLVTYGPHAFDDLEHDEPVRVRTWAKPPHDALAELNALRVRGQPDDEYPWAARLECALAVIARRLTGQHGRPVLVTIGKRPPHPPAMDVRTLIIPCPERQDWRVPLRQLKRVPGISFGALCDEDAEGEIWTDLGRDGVRQLSVVDIPGFADGLRLSAPVQRVPFPIFDEDPAEARS